ncbi:MAG: hypothetical protein HY599_01980 [Candidatus Omnitrophica bacterium]|nr:hypothetical protein [Candidatus Omnitrophota bacterium]
MRGRWEPLGVLVVACASLIVSTGMGSAPPSVDVAALKADVERELPPGTGVSRVIDFLDAHELPHSGLVTPDQAIYSTVLLSRRGQPGWAASRAELQFWFTPDGRFVHFAVREHDHRLN